MGVRLSGEIPMPSIAEDLGGGGGEVVEGDGEVGVFTQTFSRSVR